MRDDAEVHVRGSDVLEGGDPIDEPVVDPARIEALGHLAEARKGDGTMQRAELEMSDVLHVAAHERGVGVLAEEVEVLAAERRGVFERVAHRDDDARVRERLREERQPRDVGVVLRDVAAAGRLSATAQRDDLAHVARKERLALGVAVGGPPERDGVGRRSAAARTFARSPPRRPPGCRIRPSPRRRAHVRRRGRRCETARSSGTRSTGPLRTACRGRCAPPQRASASAP